MAIAGVFPGVAVKGGGATRIVAPSLFLRQRRPTRPGAKVHSIVGHFIGEASERFSKGPLFVKRRLDALDRRSALTNRALFEVVCGYCGRLRVKAYEDLRRARTCGRDCPAHLLNQRRS